MKRILLFVCSLGIIASAYADMKMPANCDSSGFTIQSKELILHTTNNTQPELYIFYNTSTSKVLLTHPHQTEGASAGWDSYLQPNQASAFLVDRPRFVISCARLHKNDQSTPASCAYVLSACRYQQIKITDSHMQGTFWVAEDKPMAALLSAIRKRGIHF